MENRLIISYPFPVLHTYGHRTQSVRHLHNHPSTSRAELFCSAWLL